MASPGEGSAPSYTVPPASAPRGRDTVPAGGAALPWILLALLAALAAFGSLAWAWRAHDALILLAYRAEMGRPGAAEAWTARVSRPPWRWLARWMRCHPARDPERGGR